MLGKIAKRESRGTLFGAFSFVGDFGILIINLIGGQLYNIDKLWPFYLALISLSTLLFFLILFAVLK